jgi:hypothetical protein
LLTPKTYGDSSRMPFLSSLYDGLLDRPRAPPRSRRKARLGKAELSIDASCVGNLPKSIKKSKQPQAEAGIPIHSFPCFENKLTAPMLGCGPFSQFYIITKVLQPFYMVATYSVA